MSLDVGAHLKAVRQMYGLSQRELAKRAGVTNGLISLIEQNRVSLRSVPEKGSRRYSMASPTSSPWISAAASGVFSSR